GRGRIVSAKLEEVIQKDAREIGDGSRELQDRLPLLARGRAASSSHGPDDALEGLERQGVLGKRLRRPSLEASEKDIRDAEVVGSLDRSDARGSGQAPRSIVGPGVAPPGPKAVADGKRPRGLRGSWSLLAGGGAMSGEKK